MSNISIWLNNRTLSGATTPGQSEPRSNSNELVLHIPLSSSIIGTTPSYFLRHNEDTRWEGALLLFRDAVYVFSSCSRLGYKETESLIRVHIMDESVCVHFVLIVLWKTWFRLLRLQAMSK